MSSNLQLSNIFTKTSNLLKRHNYCFSYYLFPNSLNNKLIIRGKKEISLCFIFLTTLLKRTPQQIKS